MLFSNSLQLLAPQRQETCRWARACTVLLAAPRPALAEEAEPRTHKAKPYVSTKLSPTAFLSWIISAVHWTLSSSSRLLSLPDFLRCICCFECSDNPSRWLPQTKPFLESFSGSSVSCQQTTMRRESYSFLGRHRTGRLDTPGSLSQETPLAHQLGHALKACAVYHHHSDPFLGNAMKMCPEAMLSPGGICYTREGHPLLSQLGASVISPHLPF